MAALWFVSICFPLSCSSLLTQTLLLPFLSHNIFTCIGKTTTVIETVYQLMSFQGVSRALLVAPSNDAADILVEKLASYFPPSEMCRILAYSRSVDQAPEPIRKYCAEIASGREVKDLIGNAKIVVSTVNNASRLTWHDIPRGFFDVLLVDEAGHCTEPELMGVVATLFDCQSAASLRSPSPPQIILAGDPKQLGPVITSAVCKKFGMKVSYMERLSMLDIYKKGKDGQYFPGVITKLIQNYRSHPSILKFPNDLFYDGDLITAGDPISTHSLCRWEHLSTPQFPIIFHAIHGENQQEGDSPSWFNAEEAQQSVAYVDLLVQHTRPGVQPADIGIITPYARQAQKIRKLLDHNNYKDVKVGSVETFQGQERRCIIVSTVRADVEHLSSDAKFNLGFVANAKRFNVAITRAKSLLVVVGDPNVLATDKDNWLPFLRYCKNHGGWTGEDWVEPTDSDNEETSEPEIDLSDSGYAHVTDSAEEEWDIVDTREAYEGGFINREE